MAEGNHTVCNIYKCAHKLSEGMFKDLKNE